MTDRRLFARIKIKIPLKFLNPNTGKEGKAETVDISANGVGFITEEELSNQTPLEMWLVIPGHADPVHLVGEVIWSCDLGDNVHNRVGVHFKEERLLELSQLLSLQQTNPIVNEPTPQSTQYS